LHSGCTHKKSSTDCFNHQENPMSNDILIYGANGYTARIILELAQKEGAKPILAGRSLDKIEPLAKKYGLTARAFALDDPNVVAQNLAGVAVVLNCAGPFSRTAQKMAEGCIKAGIHYLDITGEIDVFEKIALLGPAAKAAGVMLMPGTGFDVVPSDCLAAHLKRRLPDAISLTLAIQAIGQASHGTATTIVENMSRGGAIRKGGKLTPVPSAWASRNIDFGNGPVATISIPWGDVSTAWHSTGIPDIQVFMAAPTPLRVMARISRYFGGIMGSSVVQEFLKRRINAGPSGPDAEQRRNGASYLWGEVRNAAGQTATTRLKTMDGYDLSAVAAWDIAKRTAAGASQSGFQTPSTVFGPDYILNLDGSTRTDL
jgi:short subunit dehydrogenase-like uncharacterized protein